MQRNHTFLSLPRWRVTQGTSEFTCYAATAKEAQERAALVGFKRPRAVLLETTPVDQERELQELSLRAASPLRGRADQHDAGDLGLFRAANEPGLF